MYPFSLHFIPFLVDNLTVRQVSWKEDLVRIWGIKQKKFMKKSWMWFLVGAGAEQRRLRR
jgi:hypothetical protein